MSFARVDSLIKTKDGDMKLGDVPLVTAEEMASQNWRIFLTMGILALVSIMFLVALNSQDYNRFYNMSLDTNNLTVSYVDKDSGSDVGIKKFVMGNLIQVYSHLDDLEIQYIIPQFSSQYKMSDTESGVFGNIGDSYNNVEPIMAVRQGKGKGSLFEIDLGDSQPISMIAIMGSSIPKEYAKLDTAKVIIRENGIKKWQSCNFLKPEQYNYVKVTTS